MIKNVSDVSGKIGIIGQGKYRRQTSKHNCNDREHHIKNKDYLNCEDVKVSCDKS